MKFAPLLTERQLWREGYLRIAGVDEVGCGAWAGEVYAAAVILDPAHPLLPAQDSKQLTAAKREAYAQEIQKKSLAWSIGRASLEEIDHLNIREAAFLAMRRALNALSHKAEWVLCDGFELKYIAAPCTKMIKGDARSRSIAAASILAKVARDQAMTEAAALYPMYHFGVHKGYGTKKHSDALKQFGPCPLHRLSFTPIKLLLNDTV